ncbi:nose resistant to fluoxetine protein 6-like [Copidosoma floridanum]|uniref:nose resistant to fluoxetine protein 6-like n=1 Tax=Copidosoma floridanum TaxID=29053 RepID=UPI0006C9D4D4|nr:nose resistant to fluoxetine protein 6-like [Copidosoma floridanum]
MIGKLCVVGVLLFYLSGCEGQFFSHDWNSTDCLTIGKKKVVPGDDFWFDKVPVPPIVVATSNSLPEGACKRQLKRYIEELGNGTFWATQMFDSSAKYPYGIIDGQTRHLGSFDQCYRIEARLPSENSNSSFVELRSRYCLVDFKYERKDNYLSFYEKLDHDFDPNGSAWEAVKEKGDYRRIRRYMLQMALCVPAACTPEDIRLALQEPYDDFGESNGVAIKVGVDQENCQTMVEEPEFSTGAYVYCGIVLGILVLVIISSLYDGTIITEEDKRCTSKSTQMLLCFSVKRNLRTIFQTSYQHRGLDTIHMIRFFSMCLVLVGHRMMQYYANPTVNMRYHELTFDIPSFVMVHNGPIIVDGFFGIGGLLTCYVILDQFQKSKNINFFGLTFIRFLRFTPAYALVIFFYSYVFQHIGSGPQWQTFITSASKNCAATWWANLFYLNNYMTMDKLCMFQSWYLAVDFHLYLLTIVLLCVFCKCPRKIGYSILGGVTVLSILIPFYITYAYHVQPLFIGFSYMYSVTKDEYFINHYVKTHMRMTSYLVGVICGAILYDYKDASWRISKRWSHCLFILFAVVMSVKSQSLGHHYYNPNSKPSLLEVALYACLHRGFFALSFCSIVLLITMGDGLDFHYNFLTPRWVQPLGRLTYSVFLCHNIIQMYQIGTMRSPRTYSIHNIFWDFVSDVVYSFSLALLIAIGIEGPFRKLEKHFITQRSSKLPKKARASFEEEIIQNFETRKID